MHAKRREETERRVFGGAKSEGASVQAKLFRWRELPRLGSRAETSDTAIGYYAAIPSKSYEVADTRLYYPSRKHVEETGSHFARSQVNESCVNESGVEENDISRVNAQPLCCTRCRDEDVQTISRPADK